MLKFTAELSEQFRRASSLCTLKSYHISKQFKSYESTHQFVQSSMHQNHKLLQTHHGFQRSNYQQNYHQPNKQKTNYEPHNHYSSVKLSKTYNYLDEQPQLHRQNSFERTNNESHRAVSLNHHTPHCHINIKCCHQQQAQRNRFNINSWKTPKRLEQNRIKAFQSCKISGRSMNTHASSNIKSNINQMSEPPKQMKETISEINLNMISLPSKEEKQKNQKYRLRQDIANNGLENSIPRVSKLHQKNAQAAKLRISSINNLQNIHKRIQATIGFNNSLKN